MQIIPDVVLLASSGLRLLVIQKVAIFVATAVLRLIESQLIAKGEAFFEVLFTLILLRAVDFALLLRTFLFCLVERFIGLVGGLLDDAEVVIEALFLKFFLLLYLLVSLR